MDTPPGTSSENFCVVPPDIDIEYLLQQGIVVCVEQTEQIERLLVKYTDTFFENGHAAFRTCLKFVDSVGSYVGESFSAIACSRQVGRIIEFPMESGGVILENRLGDNINIPIDIFIAAFNDTIHFLNDEPTKAFLNYFKYRWDSSLFGNITAAQFCTAALVISLLLLRAYKDSEKVK